jgi:hypothetical protein
MPFPKRFPFKRQDTADAIQQPIAFDDSKRPDAEVEAAASVAEQEPDKYVPDGSAQSGVKKVEAITLSWTRAELIIAYIS